MKNSRKGHPKEQPAEPIHPSLHEIDALLYEVTNRVHTYLEAFKVLPDLVHFATLPIAPRQKENNHLFNLYLRVMACYQLLSIRAHMSPTLESPLKEERAMLFVLEIVGRLAISLKDEKLSFDELFEKVAFQLMRQITLSVEYLDSRKRLESLPLTYANGNNLIYSIIFIALHNPSAGTNLMLEKLDEVLTKLDGKGQLKKYSVQSLLGLQTTLNRICIDITTVRAETFDEYCHKLKENIKETAESYPLLERSPATPSIKSLLPISESDAHAIDFITKAQHHWFEIKRFVELYPNLYLSEATQHYHSLSLIKYFFISELSSHHKIAIPLNYQYQISWSAAQAFAVLLSRHKNHRISTQLSELLIHFMGDIGIFDLIPIYAQNGFSLAPLYQAYEIGFAGAVATLAVKNTEQSLRATFSTYQALHDGVKTHQPDVIEPFGNAIIGILSAMQIASLQREHLMTHFESIIDKARQLTLEFSESTYLSWPQQTKSYLSKAFAEVLKRFYDKYLPLIGAKETLEPISEAVGMIFIALAPPLCDELVISSIHALDAAADLKDPPSPPKDAETPAAPLEDEDAVEKMAEELLKSEAAEKARKKEEELQKKIAIEKKRQAQLEKEERKRTKLIEQQQRKAAEREQQRLKDQAIQKEHERLKKLQKETKKEKSTSSVSLPSPIKKVTAEAAVAVETNTPETKPILFSPVTLPATDEGQSISTRASSEPGFFSRAPLLPPQGKSDFIRWFSERMASPFLARLFFTTKEHLDGLAKACHLDATLLLQTHSQFIAFHWPTLAPRLDECEGDFYLYLVMLYVHQHQKAPPYDWPVFKAFNATPENTWLDKLIAFRVFKDCQLLPREEMLRALELMEQINEANPSCETAHFIKAIEEKLFAEAITVIGLLQ